MRKHTIVLVAILMVFALIFGACTPKEEAAPTEKIEEKTEETEEKVEETTAPLGDLKVALDVPISTLEPTTFMGPGSVIMLQSIYDTLVILNADMTVEGLLAESWTVSDDGLEYTFVLKDGLKFSNGEDLTADDVVFTFNRFVELPIGLYYSNYVKSAEKVDDKTVKFTTPAIFDGMYAFLSSVFFILPQDYVEGGGDLNEAAVGSGAYTVTEFVAGSHIKLDANADYHSGAPKNASLEYKFIPDPSTRTIALESGEVDFIFTPSLLDRQHLIDTDGITYQDYISSARYTVALSAFGELMDDSLREGIMYAINNEEIFHAVGDGLGQALTSSFVPETFPNYAGASVQKGFDLAKAQAAVDASGYAGEEISIVVLEPQGQKIAEVIQNQLSKVGVTTKIEVVEYGAYYGMAAEQTLRVSVIMSGGIVFGPQEELGSYSSMQDMANRFPDSEEFDGLYMQLVTEGDAASRKDIMTKAYALVEDLNITKSLYSPTQGVAYNSDLADVEILADGIVIFNNISKAK